VSFTADQRVYLSFQKRKETVGMGEQENQRGDLLMGLLIGGLLGAAAGLFFAPKSGRELRSGIKEKGYEVFKDVKEIYADAGKKATEIIDEAKKEVKELKKEPDRHLADLSR
jgi:gas vesicle protein